MTDELIRKDDVLKLCKVDCDNLDVTLMQSAITKIPAVDAVKVVRCRYCRFHHWEQEPCHGKTEHFCSVLKAQVFADFYCYHGKPKEDNNDKLG